MVNSTQGECRVVGSEQTALLHIIIIYWEVKLMMNGDSKAISFPSYASFLGLLIALKLSLFRSDYNAVWIKCRFMKFLLKILYMGYY